MSLNYLQYKAEQNFSKDQKIDLFLCQITWYTFMTTPCIFVIMYSLSSFSVFLKKKFFYIYIILSQTRLSFQVKQITR